MYKQIYTTHKKCERRQALKQWIFGTKQESLFKRQCPVIGLLRCGNHQAEWFSSKTLRR